MERKIYRIAAAGTRIEVFVTVFGRLLQVAVFLSLNAFLSTHNEIYWRPDA
jgi:hypothetical protein